MVPDRFENCATAHLIAFKQRKLRMVGGKPISANSGTLTSVICTFFPSLLVTDDGDDSVIPLDDEEEYSRVKSLDDEFGDDAILVE